MAVWGLALALVWVAIAQAQQEWRVLALRVDFPLEEPDELSTTGRGRFDLRSFEQARDDYLAPYDTPPHDRVYFERHLQALGRYYETVSEDRVKIDYEVFPRSLNLAYTVSGSALSYGNGRTEEEIGALWANFFSEAVHLADADPDGPDFSQFNSFLVIHAGVGHETGQLNDIRSVYLGPEDLAPYLESPLQVANGQVEISDGWILPEAVSTQGQGGLNGLMAKFFGHQLGLPGLSNFADGLPAVGGWSLMDVGANALGSVVAGDSLHLVVGFVPPHPMAWAKAQLGWVDPLVVRRDTTVALIASDRQADLPKAVRLPIGEGEYFLLENRQQRGQRGLPAGVESQFPADELVWIDVDEIEFSRSDSAGVWLGVEEYDAFIPGSGLLIWHVDEQVIPAGSASSGFNNDPVRQGIALEEADGYRDIGQPVFDRLDQIEGAPADPFSVGHKAEFGPRTIPSSASNEGRDTGIHLEILSAPGDTMWVGIRFERTRAGWPQRVAGGRRLRGADVDGDGAVDLLVEGEEGVRWGRAEGGLEAWFIAGERLLASADMDGDGRAEIATSMGDQVRSWQAGGEEPLWSTAVGNEPAAALFSNALARFFGTPLLVLGAEPMVLLDGISGALLESRGGIGANGLLVTERTGDGRLSLVATGRDGVEVVGQEDTQILWRHSGDAFFSPVGGDLDSDGLDEVVVAEAGGAVHILGGSGDQQRIDLGWPITAPPVIGDLEGDGFLEIVLLGQDQVHVLRSNGLGQSGFPVRLAGYEGLGQLHLPPVLLDVDADEMMEIFLGTSKGVYGLEENGELLAGWPLVTALPVDDGPLGGDLDGDGMLELAALAGEDVYIWEPQQIDSRYSGRAVGWPQVGFSAAGTFAHPGGAIEPEPQAELDLLDPDRVYCYPNPVSGGAPVHVRFFLNRPARLVLEVFNAVGDRVERLEMEQGAITPAENELVWSTEQYASGLYIGRLEARQDNGRTQVVFVRMAVSQ
ncbi:MAG: hypothetical protein GKR89_32355 [Candidatus Latescibacteria bacterium]|nr:hypothetical protein [Candidatus Latescibacterota bacterium]